jgi:peptide/nickel transport system permease protein
MTTKISSLKLPEGFSRFLNEFRRQRASVIAASVIVAFLLIAILAEYLSPYDPFTMGLDPVSPPNAQHLFGTDQFGRDLFSRTLWGTRVAFMIAVGSAGIAALAGIVLGAIPAYCGGVIDDLFSRFFDIFVTIPNFFLMILVVAMFGSNIFFIMLVIGLTGWVGNARMMRSQVLTLKTRPYVEGAKLTGAGTFRVLYSHIIPNGIYPVVANTTLRMADAILTEAGLSFLGLGDPNVISWGKLIATSQVFLAFAPWMAILPGIFMLTLVFAFNIVGDGISYVLNPRLRER